MNLVGDNIDNLLGVGEIERKREKEIGFAIGAGHLENSQFPLSPVLCPPKHAPYGFRPSQYHPAPGS